MDFGIRLDVENKVVYLYHSPKSVKALREILADQKVAVVDGGYKVRMYDEKSDTISELNNYTIDAKYLTYLSGNALKFIY